MKRVKCVWVLLLGASWLLCQACQAAAHQLVVPSLNLEQIVEKADRIFVGKVTGVREESLAAAGGTLPVTVYTFEVEEALRGAIGNTLTIKQLGHRSDPSSFMSQSLPEYRVGDVVMLFLHADSGIGLTSPVGLGQGVFEVKMDGPFKVSVKNLGGTEQLYEGSARVDALLRSEYTTTAYPLKTAQGEMPYETFRKLVLELLRP
jgi:hypothetical protein